MTTTISVNWIMRLRQQRHVQSCGLACVAMITNQSYNTVLQDYEDLGDGPIYWEWWDERKTWSLNYGTTTMNLYNMLAYYGVQSNKRSLSYKGRDCLPDLSILTTCLRQEDWNGRKRTFWHWVVCEKERRTTKIYDPWYGMQTLNNIRPVESYMRIHT